MDDLNRLYKGARGTGGITSRDGQQFIIKIYEQFPEIYQIARNLTYRTNVLGTVLENISKMGVVEAGKTAPGAARCALDDMKNKVVS
jgi:hypothetical protein